MKKKLRFIINPKSGTRSKSEIPDLINNYLDKKQFDFEICFTTHPRHATELSAEAADNNYYGVIAVGGDGSVNEAGTSLTSEKTALGIIPTGSGNGMARHLKIPVNIKKSVMLLNNSKVELIDTINVNDRFCIGTIGAGFDAHIAHLFAGAGKRGYSTYVKLVLTEFHSYKEKDFSILVDEKNYRKKCFLLTFANSSQFGNNAVIAPFADVKDGIIDISMISRFPLLAAPGLIYRLMRNKIHHSGYFSSLTGKNIVVKNSGTLPGHIDGEPVLFENDLNIRINPKSLNVIVPVV